MFLPANKTEMLDRGWDYCDLILITPDAYIDHPSFAMAVLSRLLEYYGYRVGIISQPRWQNPESFLKLGMPRLAFAVSGGNVDSMVLNYTPSKKRRNSDEYSQGNEPYFPNMERSIKSKIRPDRTTIVYCNQLRSVCRTKPLIIGGIEAGLRRFVHYDYWQDKIKRSILFDSRADILVHGMGEYILPEIMKYLESGCDISDMRIPQTAIIRKDLKGIDASMLPSYEEVLRSREKYAEAFNIIYKKANDNILIQKQDTRYLVSFPMADIREDQLDKIYELPYMRKPHPSYTDIPAFDMIKESITILRGCYGNCSFCSIPFHQGRKIISRSYQSILREIKTISQMDYFHGYISDLGGPCPNMFGSKCSNPACKERICIKDGKICRYLQTGVHEYISLLKELKKEKYIKKIAVSSGLRMEPKLFPGELMEFIIKEISSGRLKIAPESGSENTIRIMKKTNISDMEEFIKNFNSIRAGLKRKIKLFPYIMIGHPGEDYESLLETKAFLRRHNMNNFSVQQFTPTPMTLSSAIYYLSFDPLTGEKVYTEKDQKKLNQWKKRIIMAS